MDIPRVFGRITSINVRKVLWTAAEAGVAFTHEDQWGLTRDLRGPEFLRLNPTGLVPVLQCSDGVLWESNTICRYLAASAKRHDLLPTEPFPRAEVERWMDWQATELNGAWRIAFLALVRRHPDHMGDRIGIARSVERWNDLMLIVNQRLAETGAYVVGTCFTLADVVIGLSLQRWLLTPIARPPTPALAAYRERLLARPATKTWIVPTIP